ncbi:LOW QUALITY PROTEIN: Gag-pol fusion protein [Phytophthora megakarya]|uniref:Gag-pol fusion protein n=1 Tax=Phytophthora megakarya TaxID=4795 RepID=A0A225W521_9STRA|nr:LOW QUALITY PROTEIN: Gag-pol fusion protein [Phytophthora megakarya]
MTVKPLYPDFSIRYTLYVDSSNWAVGVYLMQTGGSTDRVVAYATKLLVEFKKNLLSKKDILIEPWGICWATRKHGCFLELPEFDLVLDHKAHIWVFNEKNTIINAKLPYWLRFKVISKAKTLISHMDVLSRLRSTTVAAVTRSPLLADLNDDSDGQMQARER